MTDSQQDPSGIQEPHDVLAAEEFAIPQPEPGVPRDRAPEPHDVLAAEEFAMPAPGDHPGDGARGGSLPWVAGILALAAVGVAAALRGRGRRPRRR